MSGNWRKRIHELSELEDGWHDGDDGVKLDPVVVALVTDLVGKAESDGLRVPAIFPMLDEPGMSLVWHMSNQVITLRVYSPSELELSRFQVDNVEPRKIWGHEDLETDKQNEILKTLALWISQNT